MSNRIHKTSMEVRRLSPTEAEVWITAEVDQVTLGTELRGRVVGPRCPGISTIEIAYPLRPRSSDAAARTLTAQVIIPEPNVWTEQTPFFYLGFLELWQDGERLDTANLSLALKYAGES